MHIFLWRGCAGEAEARSWCVDDLQLEERGTTVWTEIRAGIVTFLTMSYILLVNPQILSQVSASSTLPPALGFICWSVRAKLQVKHD